MFQKKPNPFLSEIKNDKLYNPDFEISQNTNHKRLFQT